MQNITISNHSLYIVLTRQLLLWKGSDLHSSITLLTTSVGFLYSTSSIPFGITAHQEWDGCRYRPYITENTGVGSTVGSIVAGIDSLQWTTVRQKKKKASRLPVSHSDVILPSGLVNSKYVTHLSPCSCSYTRSILVFKCINQ